MNAPRWFVQTSDGRLHGYYTLQVLLCDLAMNRTERVTILAQQPGFTVSYAPVTEAEIRQKECA